MSDNRSVSTDALATLGTIIDDNAGRDAIHLAVEPVIAGEELRPGADVGLRHGYAFSGTDKAYPNHVHKYLGIVDPFLKAPVKPGEMFWLIVYPRQITSLRHVWTHPDFEEADVMQVTNKQDSVTWMMDWAKKHMAYDYYGEREMLSDEEAYSNAIEAGHNTHVGPYESAADIIDSEWWSHWESITGKKGDRDAYFSCSC